MMIKIVYGEPKGDTCIIDACVVKFNKKEGYTEMDCEVKQSVEGYQTQLFLLGRGKSTDHVYIMEDGATVDHMVFGKRI